MQSILPKYNKKSIKTGEKVGLDLLKNQEKLPQIVNKLKRNKEEN